MKKRIITLLLATLMLLGCVSCANTPNEPEDTGKAMVVTEGPVSDFTLTGGDAQYTIVLPVDDTYGETQWGMELKDALGDNATLRSERLLTDEDKSADGHLIILGKSATAESEKAAGMLEHPKDYVIFTENNNIVLYSQNALCLKAAVSDLIASIQWVDGKHVVSLNQKKYVYYDYPGYKMTLGGAKLEDYVIVIPDGSDKDMSKAETINEWMLDTLGKELPVNYASQAEVANEILIGNTGRASDTVTATLPDNGLHIEMTGTKIVLAYAGYAGSVEKYFLEALVGEKIDTLSIVNEMDAYDLFRNDNFAAVYTTKRGQYLSDELLDSVSPGVLALLSNCMYYESELQKGIERGELWVYSNSSTYVPQSGFFDDMVKSGKTGTNCAMPQAWALIDMGVINNGKHLYGKTDGSLANKGTSGVGTRAAGACTLTSWGGKVEFKALYEKDLVEPGDIFYAKGHTFIYLGDQLFMAAGHDGKWHTDSNANTEDGQKACFETWVCDMKSNADYGYNVWWQMRFKEDYIPKYYRNANGERVLCPIWDESCEIKEATFNAVEGSLR